MMWSEPPADETSVIEKDVYLTICLVFMLLAVIGLEIPVEESANDATEVSQAEALSDDSRTPGATEAAPMDVSAYVVVDERGGLQMEGDSGPVADIDALLETLRHGREGDSAPRNVVVVVRPATRFALVAPVLAAIASISGTKTHLQQSVAPVAHE